MREVSVVIGILWALSVGGYALLQATHPGYVTHWGLILLAGVGLFVKTVTIYRYEGMIKRHIARREGVE